MISYKKSLKQKVMEESKEKKLSYEELSRAASDLHVQYQKLMGEYRKAMEALQNRDFEYTSFFLTMLFKVIDHPEMYKEEFVTWCIDNIQAVLVNFANSAKGEEEKEEEKKDETE